MHYFRRWVRHAALNAGCALSCLIYMALPPQWHHSADECEAFDVFTVRQCFAQGWGPTPAWWSSTWWARLVRRLRRHTPEETD